MIDKLILEGCDSVDIKPALHGYELKVTVVRPSASFIADLEAKAIVANTDLDELLKAITDTYEDEVISKWFMSLGSM